MYINDIDQDIWGRIANFAVDMKLAITMNNEDVNKKMMKWKCSDGY